MSHHLEHNPCGCHREKDKDKVAILTKEYQELIAEAKAARDAANAEHDYWQERAAALEGVARESNATANKNAIMGAIAEVKREIEAIDPYYVLNEDDWDEVLAEEESEE